MAIHDVGRLCESASFLKDFAAPKAFGAAYNPNGFS